MAHIFKWKAIYRIVKNQRSPEIEETGKEFSAEFAALLGSTAWCLSYITKVTVGEAVRAMSQQTVRKGIKALIENQIKFLRAWGTLIDWELLEKLRIFIEKQQGSATDGSGGTGGGGEMIEVEADLEEGPT